MRKSLVHLVCRGLFAWVVASTLLGCQTDDDERVRSGPPAPTEVRHDLEPLRTRFGEISTPESATWVTWNSATGGLPGPTTYWIDAVVTLESSTTTAMLAKYQPKAEGKRPNLQALLSPEVPIGPFLTGAALDAALSTSGWRTAAFLDQRSNQLIISATDD